MFHQYNPKHCIIVVVDLWNAHWCSTFTAWAGECAERLNPFLHRARKCGLQVVHMAADVADSYSGPQRDAMRIPPSATPDRGMPDLNRRPHTPGYKWPPEACCCDDKRCALANNWTSIHPAVVIDGRDVIGQGDELSWYCSQHGVRWIYYTGIAANMCVLETRPFSMEQMRAIGYNPVMVGDMVEAFVPGVSRTVGLHRTLLHVERYIAPVTDSYALMEGFKNATV